jgi:hypothetical protein
MPLKINMFFIQRTRASLAKDHQCPMGARPTVWEPLSYTNIQMKSRPKTWAGHGKEEESVQVFGWKARRKDTNGETEA